MIDYYLCYAIGAVDEKILDRVAQVPYEILSWFTKPLRQEICKKLMIPDVNIEFSSQFAQNEIIAHQIQRIKTVITNKFYSPLMASDEDIKNMLHHTKIGMITIFCEHDSIRSCPQTFQARMEKINSLETGVLENGIFDGKIVQNICLKGGFHGLFSQSTKPVLQNKLPESFEASKEFIRSVRKLAESK